MVADLDDGVCVERRDTRRLAARCCIIVSYTRVHGGYGAGWVGN